MSIALFAEEGRVPVMVFPVGGGAPYRALWVGVDDTNYLIVETTGNVRWIDRGLHGMRTETRYDTELEDWVDTTD